jgi:hypothetical protein
MTFRNLARVSAVGLLAAGALAAAATPALAAGDADLAVSAKGLTVAVGAPAKLGQLHIANKSGAAATDVTVTLDLADLDLSKAVVVAPVGTDCVDKKDGALVVCSIGDIAARTTYKDLLPVVVTGEAPGSAGAITVSVTHSGTDPKKADNTVEVPVTVARNGVDLVVFANDVPTDDQGNVGTVAPGESADLTFRVFNQGTRTSKGLKLDIKLPRHTTFVGEYEGCAINAARNAVRCELPKLAMAPIAEDDEQTLEGSLEVAVSRDAKSGVILRDGAVTVATTGAVRAEDASDKQARKARTAAELPDYLTFAAARPKDVDASDNTDTFAVHVGQGADNGGGNGGAGGGNGGNGGGGGGLPVTGPAALGIGVGGAALLAAGLALFVVTRRRRIVMVTPGDGK